MRAQDDGETFVEANIFELCLGRYSALKNACCINGHAAKLI